LAFAVGVQDLTPQLRTRLSRVERVVGVFVSLATLLLLAGAYSPKTRGRSRGGSRAIGPTHPLAKVRLIGPRFYNSRLADRHQDVCGNFGRVG
jgi:hypothetical protein